MKIAFVVHDYHRGGGHSRYVAELATRFAAEHEVHVFTNRAEESGGSHIRFHHIPALRANVVVKVLSFAAMSKLLVRGGFDIVHSQGYNGPHSDVITAHICNAAWTQALSRFASQSTRERIFHAMASRLEKGLYKDPHGAHVIAISKRVARDLEECYGCRAPMHLVYHGVDLNTFSPQASRFRPEIRQQLQLDESTPAFLYVGDLRKGGRQSMQALRDVPAAHLLLLSPSDAGTFQAFAQQNGVENRVHFLPHTTRVEAFYGAADAFVLPTPYDAFGMVVTEAMACGLPVIVSKEAGASELIEHGHDGLLLLDHRDVTELARHMKDLCANRAWADRLGAAARQTAERYSWDTVAQQTMRVYQEVMALRNGSRELCDSKTA